MPEIETVETNWTDTLLQIVSYRRGGRQPDPRELTPTEWGSWAGRIYGMEVQEHRAPSLVGLGPGKVTPGSDACRKVRAIALYRRKATALALFERAAELGFDRQAERFAEAYKQLPGPHPNEASRGYQGVRHAVRTLELAHRVSTPKSHR